MCNSFIYESKFATRTLFYLNIAFAESRYEVSMHGGRIGGCEALGERRGVGIAFAWLLVAFGRRNLRSPSAASGTASTAAAAASSVDMTSASKSGFARRLNVARSLALFHRAFCRKWLRLERIDAKKFVPSNGLQENA